MQRQEIIKENNKTYLMVALPTLKELFSYGLVSKTGKNFVYRKWNHDKTEMSTYINIKFDKQLIKNKFFVNQNKHCHTSDIVDYEFQSLKGCILPALKLQIH